MTLKSELEVTQDHSNRYHSKACVRCSILHHLRDKARYYTKIVIFFIPTLHSPPPLGVPVGRSKYCHLVWCGKTRMVGLPDGGKK